MKKLSEQEIIRLMREEWNKKISRLLESEDKLSLTARINGEEETVISRELKVKSEKGLLYTVVDVTDEEITLRKSTGETFPVSVSDFKTNYTRD